MYLLNVRPNEVEGYVKVHRNTRAITGSNLAESLAQVEKNSYVIIEDIICVSSKEEQAIRLLLNYRAHHDNLRVICIGHMLYRTRLLTLVPLFNYLIFTLVNASRGLLKAAATLGFHLDKEESAQWIQDFTSRCAGRIIDNGDYMFIDCSNVVLYHSSTTEQPKPNSSMPKRVLGGGSSCAEKSRSLTTSSYSGTSIEQKFASCFTGHPSSTAAVAFFSVISQVLKRADSFRADDLSFAFDQARAPGRPKRISVVDYTCALLCDRPTSPPSVDFLVLHRYLCERAKIPALFIRNPYFWSTTSDASDVDDDDDRGDDDDGNVCSKAKIKRGADGRRSEN